MRVSIFLMAMGFFSLGLTAHGQQIYTIKGVISKKQSTDRVAKVLITNMRSHEYSMSDDVGWFTAKAAIGDTLLFSKLEFTDLKIAIAGPGDIPVYMDPVIVLSEVRVKGQTKKDELQDIMSDYRKQGTFYNGKPPVLSFLTNPITGIYELFGATPGRARRFAAFSKGELEYTEVKRRYNLPFVKRITGASDTVAKQFMAYYTPSYADIKQWNDYELVKQTQKSYEYYVKNKDRKNLQELNSPTFIKQTKDTVRLSRDN